MRMIGLGAAVLLAGLAASPASATPASALPSGLSGRDDLLSPAAGGCGPRFYRAPNGFCYPKPYYGGYYPPPPRYYGPPRYYPAPVYGRRCWTQWTQWGYRKVCRY